MGRILIVDDSRTMQMVVRVHLSGGGHELVLASNGREALEVAKKSRPDLILSDVWMPEMDGIELCANIKASPELRHVPVVLMSSRIDETQGRRASDAGADAVLDKPLDPEVFKRLVDKLLTKP